MGFFFLDLFKALYKGKRELGKEMKIEREPNRKREQEKDRKSNTGEERKREKEKE